MTTGHQMEIALSRRHWIVLAATALSGCGGGGIDTAGLPGTGGTGIYVSGSISGLGSVIVNGIKFDDLQASANGLMQVDGVRATSADMRLGMVAAVQGTRSVTLPTTGTANSIEVWSIAQGSVTQVNGAEFHVAGMIIQTDSATVFDGIGASLPQVLGQRVIVWGLQAGADGGLWRATRVAVAPSTLFSTTGVVAIGVGSQPLVNGLLLSGPATAGLSAGQLVRVMGTLSLAGNSLAVTGVKLWSQSVGTQPTGEVEIEGLVTALLPGSHFMLGNIEVDASGVTSRSPANLIVALGGRIEVYGTWQSGILRASKLELESQESLNEAEIEGTIEEFTSQGNFVVRGQRCDATLARFSHGTAANLVLNAKVKLTGSKDGEILRVTALEFED